MSDQKTDRRLAKFRQSCQAANNLITDKQATDMYNVRDAVHALFAFRLGERIVIDKSRTDTDL